ncbi:MAG: TatD family hydrolase [Alistipes sp.]|nr:TatD family hydrolase [Alistipes sp.]
MIDTHSHIYTEEFDADRAEALARAREVGVEMLLLPDIDSESRDRMFDLAKAHPDYCRPMVGLHPTSVNDNPRWREELDMVEALLNNPPMALCGVGEIGLDLYWSRDFYREQREVLHAQLELALKYDKAVAIHTRSAYDEMLDAVATYRGRGLRGVFHAYASDADMARKLLKHGDFVFGIGGVVTFKNSGLDRVVAELPTELLILETDCPYLTPVPHRGKRNESSYVEYVCRKVADIHGLATERVDAVTTATARRIFAL